MKRRFTLVCHFINKFLSVSIKNKKITHLLLKEMDIRLHKVKQVNSDLPYC